MDVREKLVELLKKCGVCNIYAVVQLANALAENGVTVQEWISVEDRLPEKNRKAVLIALRWEETDIGWYDKDDKCWQSEFINSYDDGDVTHWMPLPQPPKVALEDVVDIDKQTKDNNAAMRKVMGFMTEGVKQ